MVLSVFEGGGMAFRLTIWCIILTALMTGNAYAYIDPGTGSVVTAAIIGFFAAAVYTVRKYFYRMKDLFTSRYKGNRVTDSDEK